MARCLCETLPADFGVGIGHARKCPAGHRYVPVFGSVSLVAKPCKQCGRSHRDHPETYRASLRDGGEE